MIKLAYEATIIAVEEILMTKHRLYIAGDISTDAFREFDAQLSAIEKKTPTAAVTIVLNSGGGSAYDALAFSSRIRLSSCYINIILYGQASSAAVLILASGRRRYMTKESWVMVHEDQCKFKGDVSSLEREVAHSRRMEIQWNKLLEGLTDTEADKWESLHKATTYLSAPQCLSLGLVDRIL